MATKLWAVTLILACTLFVSSAQIFFKIAAPKGIFTLPALSGFVLMGIGMIFLTLAMKFGEVSVIAPVLATNYIWVNLLAYYIFSEPFPPIKLIGTAVIVLGVSIISWGGKN